MADIKINDLPTKTDTINNSDKFIITDSEDSNASKNVLGSNLRVLGEAKRSIVIAKDGTGDYNCTGTDHDGDDQVVINNAITNASAGDVIIFKPDTYYLKGKGKAGYSNWGSIHIEKSLHIIAYGCVFDAMQGTTTPDDEDDEYIVAFQPIAEGGCDNSSWSGGYFTFTDRSISPTDGGGGIWLRSTYDITNVVIRDLEIVIPNSTVFGNFGIYTQTNYDITIENCIFRNTISSAITFDGDSTDLENFFNLTISGCKFYECSRGIRHNNESYFYYGMNIDNCIFIECVDPILISSCYHWNIDNCILVDSENSAIRISGITEAYGNINNCNILRTTDSIAEGIKISTSSYINVSNCVIKDTSLYAIHSSSGANSNLNFSNLNIIQENSVGNGHGIYFYWGSSTKGQNINMSEINYVGTGIGIYILGKDKVKLSNISIEDTSGSASFQGVRTDSNVVDLYLSNISVEGYSSGTQYDLNNIGIRKIKNCNGLGDTFETLADASAQNNSVYYSSTQSKLVYKDSGGTINNLY